MDINKFSSLNDVIPDDLPLMREVGDGQEAGADTVAH